MKILFIKCLLLAVLWPTTLVYGQLVEKERISIDAKEANVIIAPNGKIFNFAKGVASQTTARTSGGKINLAEGEKAMLVTNDFLYTRAVNPQDYNAGQQIIKYQLGSNSLNEVARMDYPSYNTSVSFFESGGFIGQLLDGSKIEFYSSNLELRGTNSITLGGYSIRLSSLYQNTVLFGTPRSGKNQYKLTLLSNSGELLFDKQCEDSGELIDVLASKNYFASLVANGTTNSFTINVFDKYGGKVWEKKIEESIRNNWLFIDQKKLILVTASVRFGLEIYDVINGDVLESKSWRKLLNEANIPSWDENYWVAVIGIKKTGKNRVGIVIAQPAGKGYKDNLIIEIDLSDTLIYSFIRTGDSLVRPQLYQVGNDLYVKNESEILKFETNE